VCTCTKCGSTSLWSTVYNLTHGKKWDFDGRPWIHNLNSTRWDKVKVNAGSPAFARDGSIALIRDPKERMVSAWKSKAACNGGDVGDISRFVPGLLKLAAVSKTKVQTRTDEHGKEISCMDLPTFIEIIYLIHARGEVSKINTHFLPQHLGCFLHHPPSEWTYVRFAGSPDLVCQLESLFLNKELTTATNATSGCKQMIRTHSTNARSTEVSPTHQAMLDAITREEYEVLGPYLLKL